MKIIILFVAILGTAHANPLFSQAQLSPEAIAAHINKDKKHIALAGYDPVSYFTANQPLEGNKDLAFSHGGVIYLFASKANLSTFKSNPEAYLPQYGGWCAYAMGQNGEKVKVDPLTYKIVGKKLYLFYNFRATNTLDFWNKDEKSLKKEADVYWQRIVSTQ